MAEAKTDKGGKPAKADKPDKPDKAEKGDKAAAKGDKPDKAAAKVYDKMLNQYAECEYEALSAGTETV